MLYLTAPTGDIERREQEGTGDEGLAVWGPIWYPTAPTGDLERAREQGGYVCCIWTVACTSCVNVVEDLPML